MQSIDTTITTEDGFPLAATQFIPQTPKANMLIAAGLGIPRQFYKHIAEYAAARNYAVRFSYWGQRDLHAIFEHIKNDNELPITYLAHSAGGQILGMTPHCKNVIAASFIGSVIPDSKNYTRVIDLVGLKFLWWIVLPVLSLFGDTVPASKVGLSTIDVPTGVVREWSAWGRSKRYLFNPKFALDLSHYHAYTAPLKVMPISDDNMATPASCFDLASEYPNAQIEQQVFQPSEYQIKKMGHFGYFRKSSQACWAELFDWYDGKLITA